MSKTFELLAESLTEIIEDMEKTGGKNLTRRVVEKPKTQKMKPEKISRQQYKTATENFVSARS